MHENERWQEYDNDGNPLQNGGRPANHSPEAEARPFLYAVSCIWLYRKVNDTFEILFQRRSKYVDRHAGFWDVSAGGHVDYGETITAAAVRECKEEVGADVQESELEHLFTSRDNKRIAHIFLSDYSNKPNELSDFHFDDKEVSEVTWIKLKDFKEFATKECKQPLAEDTYQIEEIYKSLTNKLGV